VLEGFLGVANMVGGDAEPLLFLFEVLALSSLVFAGGTAAGLAAAAVGLAGAVLTKVEGTVFAALVVAGYAVFGGEGSGRRVRAALALSLPAVAALGGWLLFCGSHGLLDIYRLGKRTAFSFTELPVVVRELVRDDLFGPRLAPVALVAALLLSRRPSRGALFPLSVAAGFGAFIVYMYLTGPGDPSNWIQWSAARLSMTPLICALFAAIPSQQDTQIQ
jgi:hypothetical protein